MGLQGVAAVPGAPVTVPGTPLNPLHKSKRSYIFLFETEAEQSRWATALRKVAAQVTATDCHAL
jgi:hypothetical protein